MDLLIGVLVAAGVGAVGVGASIYNRLVNLKSQCENSFAQIEVQLKRRADLIPNLVECVRRYMEHEQETLERVMAARSRAVAGLRRAAQQPENFQVVENWLGAEGTLGRALGGLRVAIERYPELKASRPVADLIEQLTSTENRIAFARQAYNDWVTAFNSYRQAFPQCSIGSLCGFTQNRILLELPQVEERSAAPSVALS